MSEIICPHCGSSNPIEAFECSACHKSLYEEPAQPYQAPPENDMEWLNTFRSFEEDSGADTEDESGSDAESDRPSQEESHGEDNPEVEIPEWLARIRARTREEAPPPETEPPTPPLEKKYQVGQPITTDFLHELSASEEATSGEERKESFPEWLKRISARNQAGRGFEPEAEKAPFEPSGESVDAEPAAASEAGEERSPFIDEKENFASTPPESPIQESFSGLTGYPTFDSEPSLAIPPEDDFTDLDPGKGLADLDLPGMAASDQFEELPDFLTADLTGEPVSEGSKPIEDLPDFTWLNEGGTSAPEIESTGEDDLEAFDWLKNDSNQEIFPSARALADQPESQGELPEWLTAKPHELTEDEISAGIFGSAGSDEAAEAAPAGGAEEDLPDWLTTEYTHGRPEGAAVDESSSPDNPTVPDWLVEIQASESPAPQKSADALDERIETVGPLAGYQGVLPGEAAVTHYTKPPVYSNDLQVTDIQRIRATMFDTLIAEEIAVGEKSSSRVILSQQTLRLVIGILMIGLMVIALVFDANIAILPGLYPPENVSFFNVIQSIKSPEASSPILVGLDYEPALAGEMRTTGVGVLHELMAENRDIVFVSLTPTGPVLASDLTDHARTGVPDYQTSEHVVNLGYLPGGGSALAGFAAAPQRAAPHTTRGANAWESGALQGVTAISDFGAIILMTDSTESARTWIEQVGLFIGDTPLLLVSSAQAAPALQPYVQSGQVAGMISGLNGAAAYHQLSQSTTEPVAGFWDAFQGGMLLIAAFMLLGALVYGVMNLVTRVRKA